MCNAAAVVVYAAVRHDDRHPATNRPHATASHPHPGLSCAAAEPADKEVKVDDDDDDGPDLPPKLYLTQANADQQPPPTVILIITRPRFDRRSTPIRLQLDHAITIRRPTLRP